jgi:hypothetical protein
LAVVFTFAIVAVVQRLYSGPPPQPTSKPLHQPQHQPKVKLPQLHEIVNPHKPTTGHILDTPQILSSTSTLPAIIDFPNYKEHLQSEETWVSNAFYGEEKSDAYYFSIKFVNTKDGCFMFACFYMLGHEDNFFREADIILQLINQENRYHLHHVQRLLNMQFRYNNIHKRIETGYAYFHNFSESEQHFIKNGHLKFRVVNIEFDKNRNPPFIFAMCHYQDYKNMLWRTFPFYFGRYKFRIDVVAKGCSQQEQTPFSIVVYEYANDDNSEVFDETVVIDFKNAKNNKIFDRAITIDFMDYDDNSRRNGIKAQAFTCNELEKTYVAYDCFLFRVYSQ